MENIKKLNKLILDNYEKDYQKFRQDFKFKLKFDLMELPKIKYLVDLLIDEEDQYFDIDFLNQTISSKYKDYNNIQISDSLYSNNNFKMSNIFRVMEYDKNIMEDSEMYKTLDLIEFISKNIQNSVLSLNKEDGRLYVALKTMRNDCIYDVKCYSDKIIEDDGKLRVDRLFRILSLYDEEYKNIDFANESIYYNDFVGSLLDVESKFKLYADGSNEIIIIDKFNNRIDIKPIYDKKIKENLKDLLLSTELLSTFNFVDEFKPELLNKLNTKKDIEIYELFKDIEIYPTFNPYTKLYKIYMTGVNDTYRNILEKVKSGYDIYNVIKELKIFIPRLLWNLDSGSIIKDKVVNDLYKDIKVDSKVVSSIIDKIVSNFDSERNNYVFKSIKFEENVNQLSLLKSILFLIEYQKKLLYSFASMFDYNKNIIIGNEECIENEYFNFEVDYKHFVNKMKDNITGNKEYINKAFFIYSNMIKNSKNIGNFSINDFIDTLRVNKQLLIAYQESVIDKDYNQIDTLLDLSELEIIDIYQFMEMYDIPLIEVNNVVKVFKILGRSKIDQIKFDYYSSISTENVLDIDKEIVRKSINDIVDSCKYVFYSNSVTIEDINELIEDIERPNILVKVSKALNHYSDNSFNINKTKLVESDFDRLYKSVKKNYTKEVKDNYKDNILILSYVDLLQNLTSRVDFVEKINSVFSSTIRRKELELNNKFSYKKEFIIFIFDKSNNIKEVIPMLEMYDDGDDGTLTNKLNHYIIISKSENRLFDIKSFDLTVNRSGVYTRRYMYKYRNLKKRLIEDFRGSFKLNSQTNLLY